MVYAVAVTAIPLVFLSAFAVGFVINGWSPQSPCPGALRWAQSCPPTDAVAVSIAKRSGVSHRITVLEGGLSTTQPPTRAALRCDERGPVPLNTHPQAYSSAGRPRARGPAIGWVVGGSACAPSKEPLSGHGLLLHVPFIARRAPGRLRPGRHRRRPGLSRAVAQLLSPQSNRRFSELADHDPRLKAGFSTMGLQAFGIVERPPISQ